MARLSSSEPSSTTISSRSAKVWARIDSIAAGRNGAAFRTGRMTETAVSSVAGYETPVMLSVFGKPFAGPSVSSATEMISSVGGDQGRRAGSGWSVTDASFRWRSVISNLPPLPRSSLHPRDAFLHQPRDERFDGARGQVGRDVELLCQRLAQRLQRDRLLHAPPDRLGGVVEAEVFLGLDAEHDEAVGKCRQDRFGRADNSSARVYLAQSCPLQCADYRAGADALSSRAFSLNLQRARVPGAFRRSSPSACRGCRRPGARSVRRAGSR